MTTDIRGFADLVGRALAKWWLGTRQEAQSRTAPGSVTAEAAGSGGQDAATMAPPPRDGQRQPAPGRDEE